MIVAEVDMSNLKPCISCGSREIETVREFKADNSRVFYECRCKKCGLTTGRLATPEMARTSWNKLSKE